VVSPVNFGLVTAVALPVTQAVPQQITAGYGGVAEAGVEGSLLLESGDKLVLEDGSGDVLLEG